MDVLLREETADPTSPFVVATSNREIAQKMKRDMAKTIRLMLAAVFFICASLLHIVFSEDDTECLRQFHNSVFDPSGYLYNWDFLNTSKAALCSFTGVTCWNQQENRILDLKLPQAGLSGQFPSGLSKCSSLQMLDLSSNVFSGTIPVDICTQMPYLTSLDLSQNSFTGVIPDNLAKCVYLNVLNLQHNQLTGTPPWGIGVLPRLTTLDLSSNLLSGVIPSSYTNRSAISQAPFPASGFENNSGLCGPPLTSACPSSSTSPNARVIVGVAVAGAIVFAIIFGFYLWWVLVRGRSKGRALLRDEHKWASRIKGPKSVAVSMFEKPLVRLKLSDLMAATNDFSKDNIIGSGRTGTVYKATLSDGSMLAIKRLQMSSQTDKQFKSEMNTLGHLRHRNLVPLLGYCVAAGEKLLVYKHMVNGTLRDSLHEVPDDQKLDWATRLKIAIGGARGLAWLHHSCNPRIIHRNISATSILLDDDYEARITDFGLARLMNPVDTHISTFINGDFGDVGYVAPEYVRTLVATMKGDVYSFGVVLLELITGQKAMDVHGSGDFKGNLAEWIAYLSNNGRVQEAIDSLLSGRGVDDELVQFLRVGCACVLSAPKERPTMYEVYQLLRAIGEKYAFTDQNDEIPLCTESGDTQYTDELIVTRES